MQRLDKGDILGGAFKKPEAGWGKKDDTVSFKREKKEKVKMDYQQIMKAKEENEEFRSGKKHKKSRGADAKIHRKFQSGKRGKKTKGKSSKRPKH